MSNSKPKYHRYKFTVEEDIKLRELVEHSPDLNWDFIASQLPGRNRRQCRERWKHYLSGDKNKPWTPEEDELLLIKYQEHGPKWSLLSSFFSFRTDTQIKNRWQKLSLTPYKQISKSPFQSQNPTLEMTDVSKLQMPNPSPDLYQNQVTFGDLDESNHLSYNLNLSFPLYSQTPVERSPSIPLTLYSNDKPSSLFINTQEFENESDYFLPSERQSCDLISSLSSFSN